VVRRVHKQAFVVLPVLAAVCALIEPRELPLSVLVGGLLGLANLKGLQVGLERLLGSDRPAAKLWVLGMFRLFLVSAVIILLARARAVNLVALAGGFTVVIFLLVVEGVRTVRRDSLGSSGKL
jgi:hypothetical protein